MAAVPRLPPMSPKVQKMAKVCSVKGMAEGMLIQEHTAISTAHSATYTRSFV